MIILYFFISVVLTYLTVYMLDSYMNKGEILDFIRIYAAKFLAKKSGVYFDDNEMSKFKNYDFPHYFERLEAYDAKYWEIAFYTKLMNPFICKSCMSFYIGAIFATGFIYNLEVTFCYSIAWYFVQNLIVSYLIELKLSE